MTGLLCVLDVDLCVCGVEGSVMDVLCVLAGHKKVCLKSHDVDMQCDSGP